MNQSFNIISLNKEYVSKDSFCIDLNNRAFRYGDGVFESLHANACSIQFLDNHFNRIVKGANLLGFSLPDYFSLEFLNSQTQGLLHRCRLYQGAKVRLFIYRKSGGLYIPSTNDVDILIEAEYLSKGEYELNDRGLIISIFKNIPKVFSSYSEFKTMNALPFVLAGVYANEVNCDDAILVDESGFLVEATSSNLFLVYGKTILTPCLNVGCVDGIMRTQIIKIAKEKDYQVLEKTKITELDLLNADEVFLTNAIQGIKWVTGFGKKRFFKRVSVKLIRALNKKVFD